MSAWRERGSGSRGRAAPSLRAPSSPHGPAPPAPPGDRPHLRLAVSRGALGIELDAPFALGPLSVTELQLSLPGVRFPVDLSGGVARFRHRRGAMQRLAVEVSAVDVVAWAAPRLASVLASSKGAAPDLVVAPVEDGLLFGLHSGGSALAFEVLIAPMDGDLRLLLDRARGVGLSAPPHVLALHALLALAGPLGRMVSGAVVVPGAAAQVGRHVLPYAGARAPSAEGVRWETARVEAGQLTLEAAEGAAPAALSARAVSALELVELAGEADLLALRGDLEGARGRYLALLERAPRHRALSERLAWIDALAGERAEAALSTLVESVPATSAGVLGGKLLAEVGDADGARVALGRAAQAESYGPLAALTWLEVAALGGELDQRLDALTQAVARAPALAEARWARLGLRLELADARGALADAEHLEAAARGPEARLGVWRRAAEAFLSRGFVAESSALFERALRYAPADVDAVSGLGRALRSAGQARRALDLFARAAALAARNGRPAPGVELDLCRALVDVAGDRPAAVARARAVPPGLPESFEARFLEGRYRAELGDLAGAGLAFGRLADAVDLAPALEEARAVEVASFLREAAEIEEDRLDDLLAAQRLLGLALRLRPRDRGLGAAFRRVAAEAMARGRAEAPAPPASPTPISPRLAAPRLSPRSKAPEVPELPEQVPEPVRRHMSRPPTASFLQGVFEDEALTDEVYTASAVDEQRVQDLTARVRADPDDHANAMALADALARLGRDLDLLALLSARMEEGDDTVRQEVLPRRRAVLLRLAEAARGAGRVLEAELYENMAASEE